ncbi:MAG TPA: ECF-type sigma factor [Blastocatellia bacterium]|nr:ECF-type sigma factor [Blastocatellia bacterium]
MTSTHDATRLLVAWSNGDQTALEEFLLLVYQELHCPARGYLRRERPGLLLQPTMLINEAHLRLKNQRQVQG